MVTDKRILYGVFLPFQLLALYTIFFIPINWIFLFLGWLIFCGLGSAVVLHRIVSHRSFSINRRLEKFLVLLSCFCVQGTPLWWAAVHRGSHHAFSDEEKDAHSPKNGIFHAYMGWIFTYKMTLFNLRSIKDLRRDRFHLWVNNNYILILFIGGLTMFLVNPQFALWFWIVPAALSFHQESIVNVMCHNPKLGYKNYNCGDDSVNIKWLSFLTWGQALHNNHHKKPGKFLFSTKEKEWDPVSVFIPILLLFGGRRKN